MVAGLRQARTAAARVVRPLVKLGGEFFANPTVKMAAAGKRFDVNAGLVAKVALTAVFFRP